MAAERLILAALLLPGALFAQTQATGDSSAPKGMANPAAKATGVNEVPLLDPASETVYWDGRTWSITNNRVMEARWEKFLNEPEDEEKQYADYSRLLDEIIDLLTPDPYHPKAGNPTAEAFAALQQAARYEADAGLCQTISNQVVAAWRASKNGSAIAEANKALEEERKRIDWNKQITLQGNPLAKMGTPGSDGVVGENRAAHQLMEATGYNERLSEIESQLKSNQAKGELDEVKRRMEFQALIIQLFFQRRFLHTIIACRLYNTVYADGNNELQLGDDTKNLFARSAGVTPSLYTLESLARETMGDVRKGVDAALYLISQNEVASGSKRLLEVFLPGEYLTPIRTLDRTTKRQVLAFERNRLKLQAAVTAKDYTLIGQLLPEIAKAAKDFDDTEYRGLMETVEKQASFHLAKAQDAAVNGDRTAMEAELKAAGEIWPRNPALDEASKQLFALSSGQGKALMELDNLLKEGDDRAIYNQRDKFIAAVAFSPARQAPTKAAIERIGKIDAALAIIEEIDRGGNAALAWEKADQLSHEYKDAQISEKLAALSTEAATYVATIHSAEAAAGQDNLGSAMALYLRARDLAPAAQLPQDRLKALAKQAFAH